ncbi:MAG: cache domain-containing protein [Arcobacteraceae bacterium]|nr:cache domain-containing protein [Arcobacteraceae bacterium]
MKHNNIKTKRFLVPILTLVMLTIILISSVNAYININMFKQHMRNDIDKHKKEYLQKHKDKVYQQVHLVDSAIKFNISQIEKKIKKSLKVRIQTALDIANFIYNEQKGKIADDKIRQKIVKHLSTVRFNEGRGYYYIFNYDTNVIIGHPLKKFINKDMTNFKDTKGVNIINTQKASIKNDKIGFSKLYFNKPNDPNREYPKIVCVSKFEPLNLVIGTGEYLDVVKKQIEKFIIDRFKTIKIDKNNYMFFLNLHNINGGDNFATFIMNQNNSDLVGVKVNENYKDAKGKEFIKEMLTELRGKGYSYTKYWYKKQNKNGIKPIMSYFYLQKDWNWIISSGFYFDDLEKQIIEMKQSIEKYTTQIIIDSILATLMLSFIVIIIAVYVSLRIDKTIKKYTDELLEKKLELELAQEVAHMGSWSLDLTTNKLNWSNETYNIFEINKNELEATYEAFLNAIHPEDKEMVNIAYTNSLHDKKPYNIIHRLLMKDGKIKWVEEKCETIFDKDGKALISNGIIQDITKEHAKNEELKQKDILLIEQEKLASMGEMIGNIAHQWRQPLSVISTAASGIKLQKEFDTLSDDLLINGCDAIINNTQYLSKTIDDFRDFIRGNRDKCIFNLKENINSFLHLIEGSSKNNNIDIILNLQEDIKIDGYQNELIQCLINIFNNAKDVLRDKKTEDKFIFISSSIEDENAVIKIKDNGGGIPENILLKIFDPYFTTKYKAQGTGLGLHMAYRLIVDGMKGTIEAHNIKFQYNDKNYTGAEFRITLPLS